MSVALNLSGKEGRMNAHLMKYMYVMQRSIDWENWGMWTEINRPRNGRRRKEAIKWRTREK